MENHKPMQKTSEQPILVIDDEENMLHMLTASLSREGYRVLGARNGREALEVLKNTRLSVVLCDMKMPVMDGLSFLAKVREYDRDITVIMMSAYATVDTAVQAMKAGAYDVITKPFKMAEILYTLKKAEERERLRRENIHLKKRLAELEERFGFEQFIGVSTPIKKLFEAGAKVARLDTTVLITGESGTGKELIARGLHKASTRAEQPFVSVNCGAIPENLIESEFFGVQKGAFTGADSDRQGFFMQADGGTLFLDEVGELPLSLQVKLLRVLQEKKVRPVGSEKEMPVDIRIIAATNRNLDEEVAGGRFRKDLLFRLNVVELHIPPLRERMDDFAPLAKHFVERAKEKHGIENLRLTSKAFEILSRYAWPGNVRELENCIEYGAIYCDDGEIQPEHLPDRIHDIQDPFVTGLSLPGKLFSLKAGREILEKTLISRALEHTDWNKSQASSLLEISYPSLLEKIKRYGLE